MAESSPVVVQDAGEIVDSVIARVGRTINLATPLAIGKANHLLNAFYRRAKADPFIELTILTALTLERPKGKSLLESRFLDPMVERVFGDYPDLDFELDRVANKLPANVRVLEFYYPAGKFLHHPQVQQEYISSNYTHVARDLMDRDANVIAQLIAPHEEPGQSRYSLSCNPDIALDLIEMMQERARKEGIPYAITGEVNPNLPYMFGDSEVDAANFHYVLDDPKRYFRLFGPPKMPVPEREHLVGLYLSTLIKDEGELQIGIGAMGDAFVNALILRQHDNAKYREVLEALQADEKFGYTIRKVGGTDVLEKGLFAASEMVVDGFFDLYKAGILKRVVYDDLTLQRLINEGEIDHQVTPRTLELLLERRAMHMRLSREDFDYLTRYGIFREGLHFGDGMIQAPEGKMIPADLGDEENRQQVIEHCLGERLKNGAIVHGGFFLGPQSFYEGLKALPREERRLFNMRSITRINHLYGHDAIDRLQRRNGRFVNTCMMVTLAGNIVSDGLEDGRVISGVGGQYNFVVMAHELPGGRALLNLRATREVGDKVYSNIVFNYGHTTIPRHLRDIVVTEYGIADLRGCTDSEIIEALLKITDSRFQDDLMLQAKKAGKLRGDYEIPVPYRNNYPAVIAEKLRPFQAQGLFKRFPFGTDLTEEEQIVGRALKTLKRKSKSKRLLLGALLKALVTFSAPAEQKPYLERMQLWRPANLHERLYRNLLINELKAVLKTVAH